MPLESHPFGMDCGKQVGSKGGRVKDNGQGSSAHTHTYVHTWG